MAGYSCTPLPEKLGIKQQKNQSIPAKKERLQLCGSCYVASGAVQQREQLRRSYGSRLPKRQPSTSMIMKFCPNYRCVAYGRVVYTQTTRCAFCRWDLKPPRMKSETFADEKTAMDAGETPQSDPLEADTHVHPRGTLLRRLA